MDVVGEGDKFRPAHLKHLVNLVLRPPPQHDGAGGHRAGAVSAAVAKLRPGSLATTVGRVLASVERRRVAAIASGMVRGVKGAARNAVVAQLHVDAIANKARVVHFVRSFDVLAFISLRGALHRGT